MREYNRIKGTAKRMLAFAAAGAVLCAGIPARLADASEKTVYVSGFGSGENTGNTPESPLSSVYAAAEKLSDGGTIVVTDTVYISSEVSYFLPDGVVLKAAEGLSGPMFEVAEGAALFLNKIVIDGTKDTLISNHGTLKISEGVSLKKDGNAITAEAAVDTADGAATWKADVLIEGTDMSAKETESETEETESGIKETDAPEKEAGNHGASSAEDGMDETESRTQNTEAGAKESESRSEKTEETEDGKTEVKESETGVKDSKTEKKDLESEQKETDSSAEKADDTSFKSEKAGAEKSDSEKKENKQKPGTEADFSGKELDEVSKEPEIVFLYAVKQVETQIGSIQVNSREDIAAVVEVTKIYDALSETEKAMVSQEAKAELTAMQEKAGALNHTENGISVSGNLPWYVQFQAKRTDSKEAERTNFEILVPYELKLWDMYRKTEYKLEDGQKVRVTMPMPEREIDGDYVIFHYLKDGTVETIVPVVQGNALSFETGSFSPFSVAGSTVLTGIGVVEGETGDSPAGAGDGNESVLSTEKGSFSNNNSNHAGSSNDTAVQNSTQNRNANLAAATGDATQILPYVIAVLAAAAVLAGLVVTKKKKK